MSYPCEGRESNPRLRRFSGCSAWVRTRVLPRIRRLLHQLSYATKCSGGRASSTRSQEWLGSCHPPVGESHHFLPRIASSIFWWNRWELNPHETACKTAAFPVEPRPHYFLFRVVFLFRKFVSSRNGLFLIRKEKWHSRQGSNLKRNVRSVSCFQLHHRSTGESGRNRTSNLRIKSALLCRIELRTQVVRPVGIEPTTPRLKVECAANCATDGHCLALPFTGFAVHLWLPLFWWTRGRSNPCIRCFKPVLIRLSYRSTCSGDAPGIEPGGQESAQGHASHLYWLAR